MHSYILRRAFYAILTVFGVSLVAFGLLHMLAGDPASLLLGPFATEDSIQQLRKQLRLDEPIVLQYIGFLASLFGGRLISINYNQSVFHLLLERFPATLELTVGAVFIALVIATLTGIVSAVKRDTSADYLCSSMSLFGISMPDFWLGTMLILLFAVALKWLPAFGHGPFSFGQAVSLMITEGKFDGMLGFLKHLLLPSFTLSAHVIGVTTRVIRTSMLEEVNKEYVTTLRAKGLTEWDVVIKHMFRNAILPVLTIFSMQFVKLLGGAIIVESVFGWPGVGLLMVEAIYIRDYPLVQAGIVFFSVFFVVVNLMVDLLYTYLDPRIRY